MKNTKTTKKTTPAAGKSEVVVASPTPLVKRKVGRPKKTELQTTYIKVRILTEKEFAAKGLNVHKDDIRFNWNHKMSYLCGKVLTISLTDSLAKFFKISNENPDCIIKAWEINQNLYIKEGEPGFELPTPVAKTPTFITIEVPVTIEVPEGCVIDTENSTATKLVFKKVEVQEEKPKALPKTWEELITVEGHYLSSGSYVSNCKGAAKEQNRNVFVTIEQTKAAVALAQLSQLREVYRQGWVPDWTDDTNAYQKWCIDYVEGKPEVDVWRTREFFLSFQSKEIAEEFLENFRDLIEQARPLMS